LGDLGLSEFLYDITKSFQNPFRPIGSELEKNSGFWLNQEKDFSLKCKGKVPIILG
jgi:hypothetical protein